jgi:hypothetical protein
LLCSWRCSCLACSCGCLCAGNAGHSATGISPPSRTARSRICAYRQLRSTRVASAHLPATGGRAGLRAACACHDVPAFSRGRSRGVRPWRGTLEASIAGGTIWPAGASGDDGSAAASAAKNSGAFAKVCVCSCASLSTCHTASICGGSRITTYGGPHFYGDARATGATSTEWRDKLVASGWSVSSDA